MLTVRVFLKGDVPQSKPDIFLSSLRVCHSLNLPSSMASVIHCLGRPPVVLKTPFPYKIWLTTRRASFPVEGVADENVGHGFG